MSHFKTENVSIPSETIFYLNDFKNFESESLRTDLEIVLKFCNISLTDFLSKFKNIEYFLLLDSTLNNKLRALILLLKLSKNYKTVLTAENKETLSNLLETLSSEIKREF